MCFNGATSSRIWKLGVKRNGRRKNKRFNGATSSRIWKLLPSSSDLPRFLLLQWSHILTDMETPTRASTLTAATFASMEPHPHGYGNRRLRATRSVPSYASMEPHPHGYGNAWRWIRRRLEEL